MINSDHIRELMNEKGYTLGKLSIKSGVSKAQLSRILREKRGAGSKSIEGILRAFPEEDIKKFFL